MPADRAAIDRLLSWEGIGRAIDRRLERFADIARANAPFRPDSTSGEHLVDTIRHTHEPDEGHNLVARVGCHPDLREVGYALMVHNGTRAHVIRARRAQSLRFRVAGRIVYATRVSHPGTEPDPFLTRWIGELT